MTAEDAASNVGPPSDEASATVAAVANPTLALDGQVTTRQSTNGSTIASPPLSTTESGDLLLALVASDGPTGSAQTISAVTGGGLTWTLRSRANGQAGTAEVWQAVAPTPLTNVTITATRAKTSYQGAITVAAFTGADTATNGATASSAAAAGAPSVSLTTTKAGSWVWGVGEDWDRAVTHTPAVRPIDCRPVPEPERRHLLDPTPDGDDSHRRHVGPDQRHGPDERPLGPGDDRDPPRRALTTLPRRPAGVNRRRGARRAGSRASPGRPPAARR